MRGADRADVEADGSHGGGSRGDALRAEGGGGGSGGVPGCHLCFHRFRLSLHSCNATSYNSEHEK